MVKSYTIDKETGSSVELDSEKIGPAAEKVLKRYKKLLTKLAADEAVDALSQESQDMGLNDEPGFKKFDNGKPRIGLVPQKALVEVAKGMTHGAKKYGDHNWLSEDVSYMRLYDAANRHLLQWSNRDHDSDVDPDSGVYHLALAACEIMMLLELTMRQRGKDDRFKEE